MPSALPHSVRITPARQTPAIAFPSGGRWAGEAGSDEGAISYPTQQEDQRRAIVSLRQHCFFYCCVGYRVAPSSVTCGDSFPPRGKPTLLSAEKLSRKDFLFFTDSPKEGAKKRRRLPAPAGAGIKSNPFFPRTCAGEKIPLSFQVCGPSGPVRAGSCHPPNFEAQRSGFKISPPKKAPPAVRSGRGFVRRGRNPQFLKPNEVGSKIPFAGEWNERCHDGQRLPPSSMVYQFLENVKGAFPSPFVEGRAEKGPFLFFTKTT